MACKDVRIEKKMRVNHLFFFSLLHVQIYCVNVVSSRGPEKLYLPGIPRPNHSGFPASSMRDRVVHGDGRVRLGRRARVLGTVVLYWEDKAVSSCHNDEIIGD